MEQIDFLTAAPTEAYVFNALESSLLAVISKNSVSPDKLIIREGKSYSSVWYDTQMAFRICCRDGHHYFSISNTYVGLASSELNSRITRDGRNEGFTNYEFATTRDGIMEFAPLLTAIFDNAIDSLPKEFDCCSRYVECSNAKHCTNPHSEIATGCGYRKILKSGRIYYGTNCNIV